MIPLGGMGPAMMGPFPPEVGSKVRQLKMSLYGMGFGCLGVIIFGSLYTGRFDVANIVQILLNVIIGIFMLKSEPDVAKAYDCLVATICSPCKDQCGGDMQCLMPWMMCNAITFVFALLFGELFQPLSALPTAFQPEKWRTGMDGFLIICFVLATLVMYLSHLAGALIGWKTYKEVRDSGVSMTGGQWASGGGGGASGGGPMQRMERGEAQPTARPGECSDARFHAFQGSGNRLGSA